MALLKPWIGSVLIIAPWLALPAFAQSRVGIANSISRPAERGPSSSVGGRFTSGSTAFDKIQPLQRQVNTIGESTYAFPQRSSGPLQASVMEAAQVGLMSPLAGFSGALSNFRRPTAIGTGYPPGAAFGPAQLPAIDAFRFTPRQPATRFDDYFGLSPVAPPQTGEIRPLMEDQLITETEDRVARIRKAALALFAEATIEPLEEDPLTGAGRYPNCVECRTKLARALRQLDLVRRLDSKDYIAPLLMTHASLEQGRPLAAAMYLMDAWERDPEFLRNMDQLDQYFGDAANSPDGKSQYLASQMARILRQLRSDSVTPTAGVLAAYCAWALGDRPVTRTVAQGVMDRLGARPEPRDVSLAQFAGAMLQVASTD